MRFAIALCIALCAVWVSAQNTLGTIAYDPSSTQDGYNLYYPQGQGNVWLLDNCGRVVHLWEDSLWNPAISAYLLEDGNLLRTGKVLGQSNPVFPGGGGGQYFEIKDPDNNVLWQMSFSNPLHRMHHDLEYLPNGNVLLIAWELRDSLALLQAGRDPSITTTQELWPDKIVEIEQTGPTTGTIVWEWHAWDHLIQDFDPNANNYGVVEDHPELIDVNYGFGTLGGDWMHTNAVAYNPELDQIALSVSRFNELWIIDHSTTTAEAASHSGGNSGMGGDILYRWGNPQAYKRGTVSDQKLYFQHNVHWVMRGMDPNHPDYGKLLMFNNRHPGNFSSVELIDPPLDGYNYTIDATDPFGPEVTDWTYTAPNVTDFYSSGLGGVQMMPNGNVAICSSRQGWTFEVERNNNDLVWEFEGPVLSGEPAVEGTMPLPSQNSYFRLERYMPNYPGLAALDLTPHGYIELDPDLTFCDSILEIERIDNAALFEVYPNPVSEMLQVYVRESSNFQLFDLSGRLLMEGDLQFGPNTVSVSRLPSGIYFIQAGRNRSWRFIKE